MALLRLICWYRSRRGKEEALPLQVRADLCVGDILARLKKALHAPARDGRGRRLSYHLRLASASTPLPETRTLTSLGLQDGTHLRLEVVRAPLSSASLRPREPGRVSRRAFMVPLAGLTACAIAGLLTGGSVAFAQRAWAKAATTRHPGPPQPAPTAQAGEGATTVTLTRTLQFSGHRGAVQALAFSPDGMQLASGGEDRELLLWTVAGVTLRTLPFGATIRTLAWEPTGGRIVIGEGTALTYLLAETGEILARRAAAHDATITGVIWLVDTAHSVVSCGLDKQAVVWETGAYQPRARFVRHTTAVEAVTDSLSGGTPTVATVSQGGVIRVWNPITLQERHGFYQSAQVALNAVAFSHQGTMLTAGATDGLIHLWSDGLHCQKSEAQAGGLRCVDSPQRVAAHQGAVRVLAFSLDDRLLASGGDDGQVILWDTRGGRLVKVMTQRSQASIHAIAFSPDGTLLAVAIGQLVELWRVQSAVSLLR